MISYLKTKQILNAAYPEGSIDEKFCAFYIRNLKESIKQKFSNEMESLFDQEMSLCITNNIDMAEITFVTAVYNSSFEGKANEYSANLTNMFENALSDCEAAHQEQKAVNPELHYCIRNYMVDKSFLSRIYVVLHPDNNEVGSINCNKTIERFLNNRHKKLFSNLSKQFESDQVNCIMDKFHQEDNFILWNTLVLGEIDITKDERKRRHSTFLRDILFMKQIAEKCISQKLSEENADRMLYLRILVMTLRNYKASTNE